MDIDSDCSIRRFGIRIDIDVDDLNILVDIGTFELNGVRPLFVLALIRVPRTPVILSGCSLDDEVKF